MTKVTQSGETSWESISITLAIGDVVYITYSKDGTASYNNDAIYFKYKKFIILTVSKILMNLCKIFTKFSLFTIEFGIF